jgi:hypothetical protein
VSIPLVGTQPFDIVIEHSDNTYEFLNHVKPCDWMDMCRKTGKIEYTPQIQFGDIALTKDGQKKYTPRSVQKVTVRANGNSVELPIFSHGKRLAPSPQAPAPPPPPYAQ